MKATFFYCKFCKKTLAILLTAALILLAFSACGTDKKERQQETSSTTHFVVTTTTAQTKKETQSEVGAEIKTQAQTKKEEAQTKEVDKLVQPVNGLSKEAVVQKYCTAYNKTKTLGTLKGKDSMAIVAGTLKLNDKKNQLVESLINSTVQSIFKCNDQWELPPNGAQFAQSPLKSEDIKIASCEESGTMWIVKLIPQDTGIPQRGKGGSGNFMEVVAIEDLKQVAEKYGVKFAGDRGFDDCVVLEYLGAESEITIDKSTGLITHAIYRSKVYAKAEHVNVSIFKDQTACATIMYEMQYPSNGEK